MIVEDEISFLLKIADKNIYPSVAQTATIQSNGRDILND